MNKVPKKRCRTILPKADEIKGVLQEAIRNDAISLPWKDETILMRVSSNLDSGLAYDLARILEHQEDALL